MTDDEKNQLEELAKAVALTLASPGCIERMAKRGSAPPDFTVTTARVEEVQGPAGGIDGALHVAWETESAGFGMTSVWLGTDGTLHCDNETMSPRFVKEVFTKLVDTMVFEDSPKGKTL